MIDWPGGMNSAYATIPHPRAGTPLSTAAPKRTAPATRWLAYSLRYNAPSTPMGTPKHDPSRMRTNVPTMELAIPLWTTSAAGAAAGASGAGPPSAGGSANMAL